MHEAQSNPLADSGKPLFFAAAPGPAAAGPESRLGEAVRLEVRSLSVMQKEALAARVGTGVTWRLASDEGAYLAGLDEAPCPLAFMTTGMISATLNELLALASRRGIRLDDVRLAQDNYYTMKPDPRGVSDEP
jgi:hypothetical protein